jgi:DNA-binding Lrp family transcriptional regulator
MDDKDVRILHAVATEGTRSTDAIHEATGIPKSTVHYRLTQLREDGVVVNDLGDVDPAAVGLDVTLVTEVYAEFEKGYHEAVGEELGDIEGVNQVYFTLGETDFVVVSHLSSREMVQRVVEDFEAIDGVRRTNSTFTIQTVKSEPNPLADFELETLLDALVD